MFQAISRARLALESSTPSNGELAKAEGSLRHIGLALAKWVGRKADLAFDKGIKHGISLIKWKVAATLMLGAAGSIAHYVGLPAH